MEISNKPKVYKEKSHLTFSCQYHVVFCPKFRRKILTDGVDIRLREIFYEIAQKYDFEILELEIMPDNVHMMIDCNPKFGIVDCVTKLKRESIKILIEEFPSLKTRIPNFWTRNVFISSVGDVSLESVKKYLEEQKGM